MPDGKEKTQRRVYVLPAELVERISAFQAETGLASEVEAARRLLDDALKSRDNYKTIIARFQSRLAETKILSEIAKDVLVGHPLITGISFREDEIQFLMKGEIEVSINNKGIYLVYDEHRNVIARSAAKGKRGDMDDEIPF